ncbi:MAG: electron transfer flavoprotein subunit alpha/FixB family protein [Halobacteriales archaeon]|nr:electron transfer flavoprotein subunit alpha/FixB family protein [Halobacteriales archaeon]
MVLAFVEHDAGAVDEVALEQFTLVRELAAAADEPVRAVAFGEGGDAAADALGPYGVETLYHVTIDGADGYAPEAWAESLVQLADEHDPTAVVAAGSDRGHEVLAHVGASLDLPMAANVLSVEAGDDYELTRQRWGGSLREVARLDAETKLLTTAPHELGLAEADAPTDPAVESFAPELDDDLGVRVDRFEEADEEGVPLGEARVVVGGGRGVGGPEGYDQLEELAELLDGTVGASRAAVYEGWRPHDDQVGLTGAKISPEIYIACGISGAIQHMVGCKGAKNILAINTDAEAAIMGKAEYAVVGDLHEVVPAIIDEIESSA